MSASPDLRTTYMGLELDGPFVAGASPLSDDIDAVMRLETAGAAAVVMHSLFEEQISGEELMMEHYAEIFTHSNAEGLSYLPEPQDFSLGPKQYLDQIGSLKDAVKIPVIGSLNGVSAGGWLHYAKEIEEAGADGLELNLYALPTDPEEGPRAVEQRYVDVVAAVREEVGIPIAVKLSPFFSAPIHTVRRLSAAGAGAVVLFNRFYQPDIDIEELDVVPTLRLSDSSALLLRVRWVAALFGNVEADLAVTGGVHTVADAVKSVMAGANVVQMASALIRHGPGHVRELRDGLISWLGEHGYRSLKELRGAMSMQRCPDPQLFQRANYLRILQSGRRLL